jgi:hypothetical protein
MNGSNGPRGPEGIALLLERLTGADHDRIIETAGLEMIKQFRLFRG